MVTNIRDHIDSLFNHLQKLMESNTHLDRQEYVLDVVYSAERYFSAMNADDRDYLQLARSAVENKTKWHIPTNERYVITEDDGYAD